MLNGKMEGELKTLKDLSSESNQINKNAIKELNKMLKDNEVKFEHNKKEQWVSMDEIKKELGIKWINYLSTLKSSCSEIYDLTKGLQKGEFRLLEKGQKYEDWEEASDITGAIKILIDLFNLKEKDFTKEVLGKLSSKNICFKERGEEK